MKNSLLAFALLCSALCFGQDDSTPKKHEVKTNVFNLIIFKAPEFTYEYLIDSESSVGASILFNLEDIEDDEFNDGPIYDEKFAFTPFYRRYISGKYASRFFLEAFGMYNLQADYYGSYNFETGRTT